MDVLNNKHVSFYFDGKRGSDVNLKWFLHNWERYTRCFTKSTAVWEMENTGGMFDNYQHARLRPISNSEAIKLFNDLKKGWTVGHRPDITAIKFAENYSEEELVPALRAYLYKIIYY